MDRRFNNIPIVSLEKEKINLRPNFQRGFVWKENQQIKLIDSIIRGYDITPLYTWVNDPDSDLYSVIDGQQRLTTIFKFLNNDFPLNKNKCEDIPQALDGMTFENLPDEIKGRINRYNLNLVEVTAELEEVEEMFQRMQMGTKLKPVEVRNARGGRLRDFIKSVNEFQFFNVFRLNTDRMQNDEIVQHICILEMNDLDAVSLKNQDLETFFNQYSETGIDEEKEGLIRQTLEFLSQDVPDLQGLQKLRRINALPIYIVARDNMTEELTPADFWRWVLDFFARNRAPGCAYKTACSAGSAEKQKVHDRIEIMQKDFKVMFNKTKAIEEEEDII